MLVSRFRGWAEYHLITSADETPYAYTEGPVTVPSAECLNLKVNMRISFMWPW